MPRLARIVAINAAREIHLEDAIEALEDAVLLVRLGAEDEPPQSGARRSSTTQDDLMALARAIPNEAAAEPAKDAERWAYWNRVGMAFFAASDGGEAGLAAFQHWSAKREDLHDAATTTARWRHYRTSPPDRLTMGTLIYLARKGEPGFRLSSRQHRGPSALEQEAMPSPEGVAWEKALEAAIDEMNARYFVASLGGRGMIASLVEDSELGRESLVLSRPADIELLYKHRCYRTGTTAKGSSIFKGLGTAWLEHYRRRTFQRLALIPSGPVPPDTFNLWRGLGVQPRCGDWYILRRYLLEVICANDEAHFQWLLGWLAYCVQHPERRAEVAVVLRGLKGIGKGMLAQMLMRLFSHHALHVSQSRHLVGHFNAHLADALFLFLDEAFWAGDKQGEGVLKALITEPTLIIEPKGINVFPMLNRLKILMASNNEWIVPASADERRYFVLDVAAHRKGDLTYFQQLYEAIEGDALTAMLHDLLAHDLLAHDLRDWNHRAPPHTAALNAQKLISADSLTRYWCDCLSEGQIINATLGSGWPEDVVIQVLHNAYLNYARDHGDRHPLTGNQMGEKLRKLCPDDTLRRTRPRKPWEGDERPWRYALKSLQDHRDVFLKAMNIDPADHAWPEEDET